jgi:rhodanese-related sulfurtransferase
VDDTGFLRNPGSARYVAAANVARFFPTVDLDGARRFVASGKGVVVDARFPDAFAIGTTPGAINVPIDATSSERLAKMAKIGKRTPLLVFCQSSACEYDDIVAKLLVGDGFENITEFPGGYREWITDERDEPSHP